ncbi:MAG: hypothetical protein CEN88_344 [Candidatus Berkelbacteria bacterium Licking1014_2]|uniref:Uncharacterized protein n=1 Tax=Candidatus Berkelbacteria bacterium Licking1014_2 TaxID=2017146 RepID=A0A554LUC1_9BACT|nr:MAG: hypothetical protein CEN88_344 [Candidatus Berkelbacteria bacterium Licking1014_2]
MNGILFVIKNIPIIIVAAMAMHQISRYELAVQRCRVTHSITKECFGYCPYVNSCVSQERNEYIVSETRRLVAEGMTWEEASATAARYA